MNFSVCRRTLLCLVALSAVVLALQGEAAAQPAADVTAADFVVARKESVGEKDPGVLKLASGRSVSCDIAGDELRQRVLAEYGSVFAASPDVALPETCIFLDPDSVATFQKTLVTSQLDVGPHQIELQRPAAKDLYAAQLKAVSIGRRLAALDGAIAGSRSFYDSLRIWNKRFIPALEYWVANGAVTPEQEVEIRNMSLTDQARAVFRLERSGYLFGTGRSRSIFASTAPPGTSHHLFMLAFDVGNYADAGIRRILNDHGWYQTIVDDPPHFTYLGLPENELPARGLKHVRAGGFSYWVPNLRQP